MQVQLIIYNLLFYVLPGVGLLLPGWLKRDGLTPARNGWIATITVVCVAVIQAWSANQLGINPLLDFSLVVAGIAALLSGPFKDVDAYIQTNLGLGAVKPTTVLVNIEQIAQALMQQGHTVPVAVPKLPVIEQPTRTLPPLATFEPAIEEKAVHVGATDKMPVATAVLPPIQATTVQ